MEVLIAPLKVRNGSDCSVPDHVNWRCLSSISVILVSVFMILGGLLLTFRRARHVILSVCHILFHTCKCMPPVLHVTHFGGTFRDTTFPIPYQILSIIAVSGALSLLKYRFS